MNSDDDVKYRLNLAKGFLREAEEDFGLNRWRSCVDNAQLSNERYFTGFSITWDGRTFNDRLWR